MHESKSLDIIQGVYFNVLEYITEFITQLEKYMEYNNVPEKKIYNT